MIVVLCHGVFETFHPAHLAHLQAAKSLGDRLIVSVTPDEHVNKGDGRPVFSQSERASIIRELRFVHGVLEFNDPTACSAINAVRPSIYAKGPDYSDGDKTGNLAKEVQAVTACDGRFVIIQNQVIYSSTAILNGSFWDQRISECRRS
jgi:cytidyltransferase-like protein